jgi:hypothetical protein
MRNPIRTLLYELFLEPVLRLLDTMVCLPISMLSTIRNRISSYLRRTRCKDVLPPSQLSHVRGFDAKRFEQEGQFRH